MKKITRKEIEHTVETALSDVITALKLQHTSKKTKKAISKVAKTLKADLKAENKKTTKKSKKLVKAKAPNQNKARKIATRAPGGNKASNKN